MDAAKLEEILSKEYGINTKEEFDEAVEKFIGLDIGIFITPIHSKDEITIKDLGTEIEGITV